MKNPFSLVKDLLVVFYRGEVIFKWTGILSKCIWKSHIFCEALWLILSDLACQQKKSFGQSSAHPLEDSTWQKLHWVVAYLTCVNIVVRVCTQWNLCVWHPHAMILTFWIEAFFSLRGVFIQMTLLKWCNSIFGK